MVVEDGVASVTPFLLAKPFLLTKSARIAFAAQGGAGLRWRPQIVKRFEAPTEPAGETSPLFGMQ